MTPSDLPRQTPQSWRARLLGTDQRPLRFIVAGAVNTAFGLAIYPALLWSFDYLNRHYMLALVIAQVVSLVFAFVNYKIGVFRTKANLLREFMTFSTFYVGIYVINWLILPVMVEVLSIPPVIAQTAFALIIIAGSYFWHSKLTFRSG